MKDIEQKISPLIQSMFPSFYNEEGPNFIAFVKAYYEWLEQNFQLLKLEDNTGFNIGDTVTQDDVTGTIVSYVDDEILVFVNGFNTFKCLKLCSELIPVTSSSGASTYIYRGGNTKRLGALYLARNLPNISDIDKTLDIFVIKFKEKYLKNIEFDTKTNKRLLVKNSLDLYRSKGSERSIDLFFRLVYGTQADVVYPGEDLFQLSAGEWYAPYYMEVTAESVERNVSLVGKQITGVTSGATAFVEKYVKRKIVNGYVHLLYISNTFGEFIKGELLKDDNLYSDSPKIIGSLTQVDIVDGGSNFVIGDTVSFTSSTGTKGVAKVTAIDSATGIVEFNIIDSGWGYTVSSNNGYPDPESYRTQSLVSEKKLGLSSVVTGNVISSLSVTESGIGYVNTDVITINSPYKDAIGRLTTNSSGSIIESLVVSRGNGFFEVSPEVRISNSTGGSTTGSGAAIAVEFSEPTEYFRIFEDLVQPKYSIVYENSSSMADWMITSDVYFSNGTSNVAWGEIISNIPGVSSNGILTIATSNNSLMVANDTIYLSSNNLVFANVVLTQSISSNGIVMATDTSGIISLNYPVGIFNVGDLIYQVGVNGYRSSSATITEVISQTLMESTVKVSGISGVFHSYKPIYVEGSPTTSGFNSISFNIGLVDIEEPFNTTITPSTVYSSFSGTTAIIDSVSAGSGAAFEVGSLSYTDTAILNTDKLLTYLDVRLNAVSYGLPQDPSANMSSNIFNSLSYHDFIVGQVNTLSEINPGSNYTENPYTLTYQPFIVGYDLKDYVLDISNVSRAFAAGEVVSQLYTEPRYTLTVSNTSPFRIGEKVYTFDGVSAVSNGIITDITSNVVTVKNTTASILNTQNLKSWSSTSTNVDIISANQISVNIESKAIVQSSTSSKIYAKRIQTENLFNSNVNIIGLNSGATANITSISYNEDNIIGLNADISATTTSAIGRVSSLKIVDSGIGYNDNQDLIFISSDGLRGGTAIAHINSIGNEKAYYRTSKGILSSISKLHDGDYYQEYSYDVISRIPLEKYSEMFKKVMHTAGTRFFGSVLISNVTEINSDALGTQITLYEDDTTLSIQERDGDFILTRFGEIIDISDVQPPESLVVERLDNYIITRDADYVISEPQ